VYLKTPKSYVATSIRYEVIQRPETLNLVKMKSPAENFLR